MPRVRKRKVPNITTENYLRVANDMFKEVADELGGTSENYRIGTILKCHNVIFMYGGFAGNTYNYICAWDSKKDVFIWFDDKGSAAKSIDEFVDDTFPVNETRVASTPEVIDFLFAMRIDHAKNSNKIKWVGSEKTEIVPHTNISYC